MVEKWSTKGVTLAFEHYEALGHQVIGFIPDYHLQYENTGKQKAAQVRGVQSSCAHAAVRLQRGGVSVPLAL